MKNFTSKLAIIFIFAVTLAHASSFRNYAPIIISADSLSAFKGTQVDSLFVFRYDATTSLWQIIPFQIDEVDKSVSEEEKYFGSPDGIFSGADELVFLTNSLGDRAPEADWIPGSDSLRLELEFFDPLTSEIRYAYLFKLPPESYSIPSPYQMQYHADSDEIETSHYRIGFNNTGQLGDIFLKETIGGNNQDIFDRIKIRFYLSFFGQFLSANEDSIIFDHAYAKVGPVRIIRNMIATFVYRPLFSGESFIQTSFFYPYHTEFKLVDIPIGGLTGIPWVEIDEFRLSFDMNENATGMKLFTAKNLAGVTVDGDLANDNFDHSCNPDHLNWTLLKGTQGVLLNSFFVPAFGDSISLYYHDARDGTTGDRQPLFAYDTGDQMSYGDNGFSLIDNLEFYVTPQTTFDFLYYNFFLPKTFSSDSAEILTEQLENPLLLSMKIQKHNISLVEDGSQPQMSSDFHLFQNYPNPFNSSTTIEFNLPQSSAVQAEIFDVTGKRVKVFAEKIYPAGKSQLYWNGTNLQGQSLSSGVYFFTINSKFGKQTRKIVLAK